MSAQHVAVELPPEPRIRGLARAALAISASLALEDVLMLVTEQAREIIGAHQAVTSVAADERRSDVITIASFSDTYAAWRDGAGKPDDRGINTSVCRENRPLRLTQAELEAHPDWGDLSAAADRYPPMRGWLAVPLTGRDGRNIGLIDLSDRYDGEFTEEDEAILVQLAQMASLAVENVRLYEAEQRAREAAERALERTARLQTVTARLAVALTPADVADVVVTEGLAALGAHAGSVLLLDRGGTALEVARAVGYPSEMAERWRRIALSSATPLTDAIRTGEPIWLETLASLVDQYPNLANATASPLSQAWAAIPLIIDGRPIGAIGLSFAENRVFDEQDRAFALTLARQCAQALEHARLYGEVEAAIRARDELLSTVSHDLKNPLTSIKGFAQMLRRQVMRDGGPASESILSGLARIDETASRMNALINELVDISSIQMGGRLELVRRPTDLVGVLRQVAGIAQQTTDRHQIVVIPDETPLIGPFDATRLERVFTNLLNNAIKYSPNGGEIAVRLRRDVDGWASVDIQDHGIGIPADDLPRVFEHFHRAGNVGTRIGGTGIGLASAHQIVAQHGGSISVVSQEGVGSTFTVRLPLNE